MKTLKLVMGQLLTKCFNTADTCSHRSIKDCHVIQVELFMMKLESVKI